jgi:hypothetical protein
MALAGNGEEMIQGFGGYFPNSAVATGRRCDMLRMYTAFTNQIDDQEAAVREIREQLQPEKNMLRNTLGIVSFYNEYAENGVYEAISSALPFNIVGASSSFIGARGEVGEFSLAIMMITSDDISFETASISSENKEQEEIERDLDELYNGFLEKGKPKLVLAYMALQRNFSGDDLVRVTDKISEDIMLFGSIANSTEGIIARNYVAFDKNVSQYVMSFAAFYGEFEPCFKVTSALEDELIQKPTIVTDAEGSVLKSLDNIPTLDYLRKMGVVGEGEEMRPLSAVPAVIFYENGMRIARAILSSMPGSKNVIATGHIPIEAKISFSLMDRERTIKTVVELIKYFEDKNVQNSLNYSCGGRSWVLGTQYFAELEIFSDFYKRMRENGKSANYIFGYSGGEFCPIPDKTGKLVNCMHNYSLISCMLG